MNKQEFLDMLAAKYHKVGVPALQSVRSIPGMNMYIVLVYDLTADGITPLNVGFAVEDEGEGTEAAYWSPSELGLPVPGKQFAEDAQTFITTKIADGTIEAAWVSRLNVTDETAEAWAMRDVAGELSDVKVLLFREPSGEINFRLVDVIVNVGG